MSYLFLVRVGSRGPGFWFCGGWNIRVSSPFPRCVAGPHAWISGQPLLGEFGRESAVLLAENSRLCLGAVHTTGALCLLQLPELDLTLLRVGQVTRKWATFSSVLHRGHVVSAVWLKVAPLWVKPTNSMSRHKNPQNVAVCRKHLFCYSLNTAPVIFTHIFIIYQWKDHGV